MRIGVTGCKSPTVLQSQALRDLLSEMAPTELHHGGCIGTDRVAHDWAYAHAWDNLSTIETVWPGVDAFGKSPFGFKTAGEGCWVEDPLPYLVRNRKIVQCAEHLIACPDSAVERIRSGTWATVRYARKRHLPITYVFPDGSISREDS